MRRKEGDGEKPQACEVGLTDTVLSISSSLNDSLPRRPLLPYPYPLFQYSSLRTLSLNLDPRLLDTLDLSTQLLDHLPSLRSASHRSVHEYDGSRTRRGFRLVRSLSAESFGGGDGGDSLAWTDDLRYVVEFVNVCGNSKSALPNLRRAWARTDRTSNEAYGAVMG